GHTRHQLYDGHRSDHRHRARRPTMSPEEISSRLAGHRLWLQSGKKEGKRADFGGASLQGADFSGADLPEADFPKAELSRCKLQGANLRRADLRDANLQEAGLSDATLFEANLAGAELTGATRLLASQLGGTNTATARLPEDVAEFKELDTVGELSRTAGS